MTEISGRQIDDGGLRALGMVFNSTLTSIEFNQASLSGIGLKRVCSGCPNLKKLLLKCERESDLTDEDVRSIGQCSQLECLSLVHWTKVTDASVPVLASLSSLREIDLSYCSGLTSAGVQSLLRSNRNFEVIILSDYVNYDSCKFCDDNLLNCIGQCCPKLRTFAVDIASESTVVSEAAFITLFKGCPLLDTLILSYKLSSDASLSMLASYCPNLKALTLYHGVYTDVGIIAVISKCTQLIQLELHMSSGVTDASMYVIAEHRRIRQLRLVYIPAVTDLGLCRVFKACTELINVKLGYLPLITDRSVLTLLQSCPKLSYFGLLNNPGLTEKSVLALVGLDGLGGIERVYFEDCVYVTDEMVSILARNCSKLKSIILMRCPFVTTISLISLMTFSKQLTCIDIGFCNVTLTQEMIAIGLARRTLSRKIRVMLGEIGTLVV